MKVQGTGEMSPRQEGYPSKPRRPHRGSSTLHTCSFPTPSAQGAWGLPVRLPVSCVLAQDLRRPTPQDLVSLIPTFFGALPGSGTALSPRERKHAGRGSGLATTKRAFPCSGPLSIYRPQSQSFLWEDPASPQQPCGGSPDLQRSYKQPGCQHC